MNFETVEVTFVHLQVCLSVSGEIWKPFFLSSSLCISVGSFTSQFMNSDLWPGTHSVPRCGGWEGRLHGDSSEAPLSTHSQCFIYGPLHFWLWWLQYLSSYLNCIFKDFIQYLHAIRYELIFLFFANYFFVCFLFNCVYFGMICCYIQNKYVHWIYFRLKMLWGMFPVRFSVSWFWWQLNTKEQVLEKICWMSCSLISPSAPSSNNWTRMGTRGVHLLVWGTELLSKKCRFFFLVMSTYDLSVFSTQSY